MSTCRLLVVAAVVSSVLAGCGGEDDTDSGEEADAARGTSVTTLDGTATEAGGCADEVSNSTAGNDHVDSGTDLNYGGVPPVSGTHWGQWPDLASSVYTADERPELGELVHSQEHGWTLVWFDSEVSEDDMQAVLDAVNDSGAVKVAAVAWTDDDGSAFPDGAHVALSHWGVSDGGTEYRQFCDAPDANAIVAFVGRTPYTDSPEPNAP